MSNQLNGCSLFLYQKEMIKLANKPSKRNVSKFGIDELQDLKNIEELFKKTENYQSRTPIEEMPPAFMVRGKYIPISQIKLTEHAYKRALERLELKHTKFEDVQSYIRKLLLKAEHIGIITATDGNESEMFMIGNTSIQLSKDLARVTTVLKKDRMPYNPVTDKISSLMRKEFRKLDRTERARQRRLDRFRYEAKAEISNLKLRSFKTRSESVRMACESRVVALSKELTTLETELTQLKSDKRQIAHAIMSLN